MNSPYRNAEIRAQQAELLQDPAVIELATTIIPDVREEVPDVSPDPPFPNGYGHFARKLYVMYHNSLPGLITTEAADNITGENPVTGFDAMLRILSFGPGAYVAYCRAENKPVQLDELTTIMGESYDTVRFFMSMDATTTEMYKHEFGLSSETVERPEGLFIIAETPKGLRFVPADAPMRAAVAAEAASTSAESEQPEAWEKCPARGMFGLVLWRRVIDLAAADPDLLAADLRAAQASSDYN